MRLTEWTSEHVLCFSLIQRLPFAANLQQTLCIPLCKSSPRVGDFLWTSLGFKGNAALGCPHTAAG